MPSLLIFTTPTFESGRSIPLQAENARLKTNSAISRIADLFLCFGLLKWLNALLRSVRISLLGFALGKPRLNVTPYKFPEPKKDVRYHRGKPSAHAMVLLRRQPRQC